MGCGASQPAAMPTEAGSAAPAKRTSTNNGAAADDAEHAAAAAAAPAPAKTAAPTPTITAAPMDPTKDTAAGDAADAQPYEHARVASHTEPAAAQEETATSAAPMAAPTAHEGEQQVAPVPAEPTPTPTPAPVATPSPPPQEAAPVAAPVDSTTPPPAAAPAAAPVAVQPSAPTKPLDEWNADDVCQWLVSLGAAYAAYTTPWRDAAVDGEFLLFLDALPDAEAEVQLRDHLQVPSPVHSKVLVSRLARLVKAIEPKPVPVEAAAAVQPVVSPSNEQLSSLQSDVSSAADRAEKAAKAQAAQTRVVDEHVQEATQQVKQVKAGVKQLAAQGEAAAIMAARTESKVDTHAAAAASVAMRMEAKLDVLVASVPLPPRISNLPRLCAHFTPRESVMDALNGHYAAARARAIHGPVVALTGVAGSGKSELAKQFALRDHTRPEANGGPAPSATASAASGSVEHRLVWFFNAESGDSLLRSYQLLCAQLRVEWKPEPSETPSETLARTSRDVADRLRRFDSLLVFDNATSFPELAPYIPGEVGVHARVLVTSLNEHVVEADEGAGLYAVSLNKGLAEGEALELLGATSGLGAAATDLASPGRADCVELIRALDSLPLAVSTAGLYIAAQRAPKKGRGVAPGAGAALYGAKEYLKELNAHSDKLLRSDASLRGQSDYKAGQSRALQMAIQRTSPAVHALLDHCILLDSQELPYDLLCEIYARCLVAAEAGAGASAPAPAAAAVPDIAAAEAAFDEMLDSVDNFSLLCVDAGTNRIFMHRSTQLQLAVLAEVEHPSPEGAAVSSAADAAPTPFQLWKGERMCAILAAVGARWPTHEEDLASLVAFEPAVPTVRRLVEEAQQLPMLHPSLGALQSQLLGQVRLAVRHMEHKDQHVEVLQLVASALKLCAKGTEAAQWLRLFEAQALHALNDSHEAQTRFQTLLDELLEDSSSSSSSGTENQRLELRIRATLGVVELQAKGLNISDAQMRVEAALQWCSQLKEESQHSVDAKKVAILTAATLQAASIVHANADEHDISIENLRRALAVTLESCPADSVPVARARQLLADHDKTSVSEGIELLRLALPVLDAVFGPGGRRSFDAAIALAKNHIWDEAHDAGFALLEQRQALLDKIGPGDNERSAELLLERGALLRDNGGKPRAASATECYKRAHAMRSRMYGANHARSLLSLAREAVSLSAPDRARVTDWGELLRVQKLNALKAQLVGSLPHVHGRLPEIIEALSQCCTHFRNMEDLDTELLFRQRAIELVVAAKGAEDPLVADQLHELAHWHLEKEQWADVAAQLRAAQRIYTKHGREGVAMVVANDLADLLEETGDTRGQLEASLEVLRLAVSTGMYGSDQTFRASKHTNISELYSKLNQHELALHHALAALRLSQRSMKNAQHDIANAMEFARTPLTALAESDAAYLDAHMDDILRQLELTIPEDGAARTMGRACLARIRLPYWLEDEESPVQPAEKAKAVKVLKEVAAELRADGFYSDHAIVCAMLAELEVAPDTNLAAQLTACEAALAACVADPKRGPEDPATGVAHARVAGTMVALRRCADALPHWEAAVRVSGAAGSKVTPERIKWLRSMCDLCARQIAAEKGGVAPSQSCLLRLEAGEPAKLSRVERIRDMSGSVVFGTDGADAGSKAGASSSAVAGAASSGASSALYKLRPFSATQSHILYYEVTLGAGLPGFSMGFSASDYPLHLLPGVAANSAAIFVSGENELVLHVGGVFGLSTNPYGPPGEEGDTLGAGLDTKNGRVFFTHNGVRLKEAAVPQAKLMKFACLGFGSSYQCGPVNINFGATKFVYAPPKAPKAKVAATSKAATAAAAAAAAAQDVEQNPYLLVHPRCSWNVNVEASPSLSLSAAFADDDYPGCVTFTEEEDPFALRPLSAATPNLFYYEITLQQGWAAMGFATDAHQIDQMPGWSDDSIGFHGDDGHVFHDVDGTMSNEEYGSVWSAGDVIGAGLDVDASVVFFTHNGKRLADVSVEDAEAIKYVCVGFHDDDCDEPRSRVQINLGDAPFKYVHKKKGAAAAAATKTKTAAAAATGKSAATGAKKKKV